MIIVGLSLEYRPNGTKVSELLCDFNGKYNCQTYKQTVNDFDVVKFGTSYSNATQSNLCL